MTKEQDCCSFISTLDLALYTIAALSGLKEVPGGSSCPSVLKELFGNSFNWPIIQMYLFIVTPSYSPNRVSLGHFKAHYVIVANETMEKSLNPYYSD